MTITTVTLKDNKTEQVDTTIKLKDVNNKDVDVKVKLTADYIWIYHSVSSAALEPMLNEMSEANFPAEAMSRLDDICEPYDLIDGIKYYQCFNGFHSLDIDTSECAEVIKTIDQLIDKYFQLTLFDDDGSWYYRDCIKPIVSSETEINVVLFKTVVTQAFVVDCKEGQTPVDAALKQYRTGELNPINTHGCNGFVEHYVKDMNQTDWRSY